MAKLCPVCKVNKMRFGGMTVKDGYICVKCWDKLSAEKLGLYHIQRMTTAEVADFLNRYDGDTDAREYVENMHAEHKEKAGKYDSLLEKYRDAYAEFFSADGIPENSSLQRYSTQILWHMLMLKKRRLNNKKIVLRTASKRKLVGGIDPITVQEAFDGKYDIGTIRETIEGREDYLKDDSVIYTDDSVTTGKYRCINAKRVGKKNYYCPACGKESSKSNLLDGCDACGTKFTIEDLGLRVSEFMVEKDFGVASKQYFSKKNEAAAGVKAGIVVYLIFVFLAIMSCFFGEFVTALQLLTGGIVFAALSGLLYTFIYLMIIKPIKWASLENKGQDQLLKRTIDEEKRDGAVLECIKENDPLFSAEGFYSEVGNMLSAVHYAQGSSEVSAFWDQPDEALLKELIAQYKDVIDMTAESAEMISYAVEDDHQIITVTMHCRLLREEQDKIRKEAESVRLRLIKNREVKTQAVCAPSFIRCSSCGASLSLMEGARCHYCGTSRRLSDLAWAIANYEIMH